MDSDRVSESVPTGHPNTVAYILAEYPPILVQSLILKKISYLSSLTMGTQAWSNWRRSDYYLWTIQLEVSMKEWQITR